MVSRFTLGTDRDFVLVSNTSPLAIATFLYGLTRFRLSLNKDKPYPLEISERKVEVAIAPYLGTSKLKNIQIALLHLSVRSAPLWLVFLNNLFLGNPLA